ncbi:peptidase domain-containing ABC transporter [Pandoraea pneumonica]|nr:peptidase domain-containing ABC transporter [Pandoraea pneumonica]
MQSHQNIATGFRHRLPMIYQTEATECGLACMAMIASYHGLHVDLRLLRQAFPISLKGASLSQLIKISDRMELMSRAVRAEIEELPNVKLPCIVHWSFNHFVVLYEIGRSGFKIHDPAQGVRTVSASEFSDMFTGVVLELWPSLDFEGNTPPPQLKLRQLLGRVTGLKRSLGRILCLALTLEALSIASPLFLQWVVDNVLVTADHDLLVTLLLAFGAMLIVQQGVSAIRAWNLMHLSTTLGIQWKSNVFNHLIRLPIQFFEKRHVGDIVSRFGTVDSIQQTLTSSFLAAVLDGIVTIVTLAMMLVYSPALAMLAIGTMALYGAGRAVTYQSFRLASQDVIVRSARTQSHFLETVRGVKALQLFQKQDERRASWMALLVAQVNAGLRSQKMQLMYQQINGVLFGIEGLLIIFFGAKLVMSGQFSIGMLMAFNAFKGQFNSRVGGLIDNFYAVRMLQLQGERLADIVLHPVEESVERGEEFRRKLTGEITFDAVQYRYAHGEPTILDGIDLHVSSGESIVLAGPTGCGKTTLLNVLLGVLKPTRGRVLIDGVDLTEIGVHAFRQEIATVLQDDALFSGSIADNINFFGHQVDNDHMIACAIASGVHFEIMAMPMAYNTLVGDMGNVLSGGQKQRVLLARALYKRPSILILDEATCHLNIEKEREVLNNIRTMNITRITVAHRPETILAADRVVLLSRGKVAWQGCPTEFPGDLS